MNEIFENLKKTRKDEIKNATPCFRKREETKWKTQNQMDRAD